MNDGEMRSRRTHYLATGTLQWLLCTPCGEETLHNSKGCTRCKAPRGKPSRGRVANRVPVKS